MLSIGVLITLELAGGVILLLATAFLTLTAYTYYVHWKHSHIPSPKLNSFYLGHVTDILRMRKELGNDELPLQVLLQKWYQDTGSSTYVIFFFTRSMVIVMDPEHIKEVTMQPKNSKSEDLIKYFRNLIGQRLLGNGVFSILDYETWKPRRQLHDPAFRKSYLKTLTIPFNESVDKFLGKLKPLADGKTVVPMKTHLAELTLDVITKVAFGEDFSERWNVAMLGLKHSKGDGSLNYLVNHSLKGVQTSLLSSFLYQYLHPFEAEGYREAARAIRMIGRDCIKRRIKSIENGEKLPNDILTHILQLASSKESVEIEDLVDDFATYYIAGQETTSNLLAFTTVLVHQHPHVLERLQAEVFEVLGGKVNVNAEDLEKLQYTEQVLLESLRMYPPAFGVSKCAQEGGITLGKYHIPAGTQITMPTACLCRMHEYFDDPDTFNPSRWDPENIRPSSFVFFPFGLGHRSCIGKHFALMEAKMALARLIQSYEITLPVDYKLVPAQRVTEQPKDNVPCILKLRN